MLEAVACQSYPEVVAALGDDGAAMADVLDRNRTAGAGRGRAGAGIVLALIGVVAPVAGMSVLGAESYLIDRVPAVTSVPVAALAFVIAAVMLLATGAWWIRDGARWSGLICGYGVVTALCAALATVSMPTVARRDGYALSGPMLVPVWTTLMLGVTLAVLVLLRIRVREQSEAASVSPVAPQAAREAAEQAALTIPEGDRRNIQADCDEALRILAERGFIEDMTLQQALAAPLGTLFTLDVSGRTSS